MFPATVTPTTIPVLVNTPTIPVTQFPPTSYVEQPRTTSTKCPPLARGKHRDITETSAD
jgi:hypothetical protein